MHWADVACRATSSCNRLLRNGGAWAGKSGVLRLLSRPDRSRRGKRHSVIRLQSPHPSPGSPLPKFEHYDARHEPTLIAAARSRMTASSPRSSFSQAELTAEEPVKRVGSPKRALIVLVRRVSYRSRRRCAGWLGLACRAGRADLGAARLSRRTACLTRCCWGCAACSALAAVPRSAGAAGGRV